MVTSQSVYNIEKRRMMIQCEAINKRKSIRFFDKNRLIEEDEIYDCLEAATKAPSPHNRQPWGFRIVVSRELILKIKIEIRKGERNEYICRVFR